MEFPGFPHLFHVLSVDRRPLYDQIFCSLRLIAFDHFKSLNIESSDIFTIDGMKMGWRMITKELLDNYPVESRNFRHIVSPLLSR